MTTNANTTDQPILSDYFAELIELGFTPTDDEVDYLPYWVIGQYLCATTTAAGNVIGIREHTGDDRVTVSLMTANGVQKIDTLSFNLTDLGMKLMLATVELLTVEG